MSEDNQYDLQHIIDTDNRSGIEFEKLRFEYAWRHFDMHARQRIQMFYFFLISIAFICGAFANLANSQKDELALLAPYIAVAGLVVSLIFLALDFRNQALYSISRRHLKAIEKNVLYPDGFRELFENPTDKSGKITGIMLENSLGPYWLFRHKFLIPLCQLGAVVLFLVLLFRVHH